MEKKHSIAILVYGSRDCGRDALAEEKYKDLASAFLAAGYTVQSVTYSDDQAAALAGYLVSFDAILVWVNPVEQGHNRNTLDALLTEVAAKGCFVSTHPEVILKMGTKDILYKTRDMDWGSDTEMYTGFESFAASFPASLEKGKIRVLKQYRGNGGNGVFKISANADGTVTVTHAIEAGQPKTMALAKLFDGFRPFFSNKGLLIDQEWNKNSVNGMVRCYVVGTKVGGFGYQEINALYELKGQQGYIPPGKRYYYTENCGLFSDLKERMETQWIPALQAKLCIEESRMPIIWDADFFINSVTGAGSAGKYTLCEINVSCVSPFPPGAIKFMVSEVGQRLNGGKRK